jgi:hypothetical protein
VLRPLAAVLVLAAVAAIVAASAPATSSRASELNLGFKWLGTSCVPAAGGTIRARVRVRMIVRNSDTPRTWAQGMKVVARLESLGAGSNFTRPWKTTSVSGLVQGRRYSYDLTVLTDNVTVTGDWRLHTKLVWDRVAPIPDVVNDYKSTTALPCPQGMTALSS